VKLDPGDLKALATLMREGRVTWARLAQAMGLSPAAAAQRVKRLERAGVIRGYAALVDPEADGQSLTAFLGVVLTGHRDRRRFLKQVADLEAVQECHHVTGDYDYLVKVRCRSTGELESLINDELKGSGGVSGTRTMVVLSTSKETPRFPVPRPPGRRGRGTGQG